MPVGAEAEGSPAFLPPHWNPVALNFRFPCWGLSSACTIHRPRAMAVSSSSWELPLVAVCQVTSTPDKQQNFKACAELVREAARLGACLAFLPEAFDFIARDPAETLRLSEPLGGNLLGEYAQLARYQKRGMGETGRGHCFAGHCLWIARCEGGALERAQCPLPQGMWTLAVLGWFPRTWPRLGADSENLQLSRASEQQG